jgi:hypothetical protein
MNQEVKRNSWDFFDGGLDQTPCMVPSDNGSWFEKEYVEYLEAKVEALLANLPEK